ncbi:hypothetical protein C8R47DRAFT_1227356 [Mycena vitilis]|nr:hypothetical protein C8R47DRAFT_1227356 [Mycena vitilis]
MDPVAVLAATRLTCFGCDSHDRVFKQCSNCRVARYCSTACQAADWADHRRLCISSESLEGFSSKNVPPTVTEFLKWLDNWQQAVQKWAVYSADLAHQPAGFLKKYCFVLLLGTQDAYNDAYAAPKYAPVRFGMRSNKEVLAELSAFPVVELRRRLIKDFRRVGKRADAVRTLIMTESCYTVDSAVLSLLFPRDQHLLFSNRQDAQARSLSTELKFSYMDRFEGAVITCQG